MICAGQQHSKTSPSSLPNRCKHCLAAGLSVLGTNYVTDHCAIEDRPWGRALSRRAGREDRRWVFLQTSLWGKTSQWWKFHFGVYLLFIKERWIQRTCGKAKVTHTFQKHKSKMTCNCHMFVVCSHLYLVPLYFSTNPIHTAAPLCAGQLYRKVVV